MKPITKKTGGIVCRDCGGIVARHWTAACPVKEGGYICPACYVKRMDADPNYRRVTRPDGSVGYQRVKEARPC